MRSEVRMFGRLALAGALWFGAIAVSTSASAQQVRDARVSLHPIGMQVGIVTGVKSDTAWVKLPHAASLGAKVEFSLFSDGGDTLAVGTINWASAIAPYEAYITDVKPVKKRFPINDFDDVFSIGALFKAEQVASTHPFDDGNAAYLASGFYARTSTPGTSASTEAEPVRAYVTALRARNNKVALAVVEACEHAMVADPNLADADIPAEEAVNYTQLLDGLKRFRLLRIADPVTAHMVQNLIHLARANNGGGAKVPEGILLPTPAAAATGGTTSR